MLTFNIGESKSLNMTVNATGIDPSRLTYLFSIEVGEVSYGFKCAYKVDRTSVTIAPLEKIIKDIKAGEYSARLDIFGDKYYMCPFSEKIRVIAPVKMDVSFEGDEKPGKDKKIETKVKIEEVEIIEEPTVKQEEKKEKKNSFKDKFTNFKRTETE